MIREEQRVVSLIARVLVVETGSQSIHLKIRWCSTPRLTPSITSLKRTALGIKLVLIRRFSSSATRQLWGQPPRDRERHRQVVLLSTRRRRSSRRRRRRRQTVRACRGICEPAEVFEQKLSTHSMRLRSNPWAVVVRGLGAIRHHYLGSRKRKQRRALLLDGCNLTCSLLCNYLIIRGHDISPLAHIIAPIAIIAIVIISTGCYVCMDCSRPPLPFPIRVQKHHDSRCTRPNGLAYVYALATRRLPIAGEYNVFTRAISTERTVPPQVGAGSLP